MPCLRRNTGLPRKNIGKYIPDGLDFPLIYTHNMNTIRRIYITEIARDIEGDTFFPQFDGKQFIKEINERFEEEIPYTYVTYTRRGV